FNAMKNDENLQTGFMNKGWDKIVQYNPIYNAEFSEKSERAGRLAGFKQAYDDAKKAGLDDIDAMWYAGWKASDNMDFTNVSDAVRSLDQIFFFASAGVAGLNRVSSSIKENPKALLYKGAVLAAYMTLAEKMMAKLGGYED